MVDFVMPLAVRLRDCDLDLDRFLERDLDFLWDFLSTFWKGGSSGMANSNPTFGSFVTVAAEVEASGWLADAVESAEVEASA